MEYTIIHYINQAIYLLFLQFRIKKPIHFNLLISLLPSDNSNNSESSKFDMQKPSAKKNI